MTASRDDGSRGSLRRCGGRLHPGPALPDGIRLTALFLALAVGLFLLPPRPAEARTWSVVAPDRMLEGTGLDQARRFARIDSLESVLDSGRGERKDRAQLCLRLADLYLATGQLKHRRTALDYLDEAASLDPGDSAIGMRWAEVAGQMQYFRDARERLAEMIRHSPERPDSYIALARTQFLQGVGRLDPDRLRDSYQVWRQAVVLDSTRVEAWLGLAATALAVGEYRVARIAGRAAVRYGDALVGRLIAAAAEVRLEDPAAAWEEFQSAFPLMEEGEKAVFLEGAGFLKGEDLESMAEVSFNRVQAFDALRELGDDPRPGDKVDWERVLELPRMRGRALEMWWAQSDARPAQPWSSGELEYWARLVEADVLLTRGQSGARGWELPTGEVWVRWGRPDSFYYDPGSAAFTSRVDAMAAAGVRFPPDNYMPPGSPRIWVWTYRSPGTWISFLFADESRTRRWAPSVSSAETLDQLRAVQALRIPDPDRGRAGSLAMDVVSFPRGDGESILETMIAFDPGIAPDEERVVSRTDTVAWVEWTLSDARGQRLDARRIALDTAHRRSRLLEGLRHTGSGIEGDPWLTSLGARVPAGSYRIAVEILGTSGNPLDGRSLQIEVPSGQTGGLLELSALQLGVAFGSWSPGMEVPPEFVKFSAALLPAPDHYVPAGAHVLGVYYETRNLATDRAGQTRFDVSYRVYRSSREIRDLAFLPRPDVAGLELIAPASMSFLEEQSGVSPEGLVVKGVELDIGDLPAGDYVLVVTILDRIAKFESSRSASFRISSH